jgi:HEPN domain-containing protein
MLSGIRLKEAKALLRAGHYHGAYYLAGYAAECALKACVAKRTRKYDFPDKQKSDEAWTHKLPNLVKAAGLDDLLKLQEGQYPAFRENWLLVRRWSEQSRYHSVIPPEEAVELLAAIAGVIRWLKRYW